MFLVNCFFFLAAMCVAGSFVDLVANECKLCPLHTYLDSSNIFATECVPCSEPRTRTLNEGSVSADDCRFGKSQCFHWGLLDAQA